MAIIQIKRIDTHPYGEGGISLLSPLSNGELGYVKNENRLYIGTAEGNVIINDYSELLEALETINNEAFGDVQWNTDTLTLTFHDLNNGVEKSIDLNHSHNYAAAASAGGSANAAKKIVDSNDANLSKGDANTPVYFSNGIPVAVTGLDLDTTGNAASATQLKTSRNIKISGDASGSGAFNGTADTDIAITLNNIVTAGTRGPSSNATLTHGGTFTVPYIKYNAKGLVTAGATRTFTLPTLPEETKLSLGSNTENASTLSHKGTFKAITGLSVDDHAISPTVTTFTLPGIKKGTSESVGTTTLSHGSTFTTVTSTKVGTDGESVIDVSTTYKLPSETNLSKDGNTENAATLAHSGTFKAITDFTVDGHIITPTVTTFTLPADSNTDTKVTQAASIKNNVEYPIILGYNASLASVTNTVNKSENIIFNPSTGVLTLKDKDGNLGSIHATADEALNAETAGSANRLTNAKTFSVTGDVTGTSQPWDGSGNCSIPVTLVGSGITAGSYGPSSGATLKHSETFTVPYITFDSKGRATSASNKTFTLPKVNIDLEDTTTTISPVNKVYEFNAIDSLEGDNNSDITGVKQTYKIDLSNYALTSEVPKFMIFKGTLGTGGTISTLNAASASQVGDTYKIITDGTYAGLACVVGDVVVCAQEGTSQKWVLIPSGDDSYAAEAGTAAQADRWTAGRNINAAGDATGTTERPLDGSSDVTLNLTLIDSGVTTGSYGPSSNASPAHGGTFTVPYITFDSKGRATAASNKTVTLPTYSNVTESASGLMPPGDYTKLLRTNIAYATCSTAAATAAKVLTINATGNAEWELREGSVIYARFAETNTASNPTLNVNETGAKSIKYEGSVLASSNKGYGGTKNRIMIFIYDGSYYNFAGWGYDGNTNTYLRVYRQTTGYDGDYPILVSRTSSIGTKDSNSSYSAVYGVVGNDETKTPKINPITGTVTAPLFKGDLEGTASYAEEASTASTWKTPRTFKFTGDVDDVSQTVDGSGNPTWTLELKNTGVSVGNYGSSSNQTPAHGGNFNIPYFSVDEDGRLTTATNIKVTLPSETNVSIADSGTNSDTTVHGGTFTAITSLSASGHTITPVVTTYTLPTETKLSKGNNSTASETLSHGDTFTTVTKTSVSNHQITDTVTTYTLPSETNLSVGTSGTASETLSHAKTFKSITGLSVSGHTITPTVTTFTLPSETSLSKGTDSNSAKTLAHGETFTVVTDTTVSGHKITDTTVTYTLPSETGLSKGNDATASTTLAHNGTFKAITGFSVSGHTITPTVTTFTLPGDNNTDTKVTNTLGTTTKAYITGTTSSSTNTGTQVFDTGVYLTTTAGELYANTYSGVNGSLSGSLTVSGAVTGNSTATFSGKITTSQDVVVGNKVSVQYNSSKESLDFVFA